MIKACEISFKYIKGNFCCQQSFSYWTYLLYIKFNFILNSRTMIIECLLFAISKDKIIRHCGDGGNNIRNNCLIYFSSCLRKSSQKERNTDLFGKVHFHNSSVIAQLKYFMVRVFVKLSFIVTTKFWQRGCLITNLISTI